MACTADHIRFTQFHKDYHFLIALRMVILLFIHSFIHLFIHSFIHTFNQSIFCSHSITSYMESAKCYQLFVCAFICQFFHSFILKFIHWMFPLWCDAIHRWTPAHKHTLQKWIQKWPNNKIDSKEGNSIKGWAMQDINKYRLKVLVNDK